MTADAKTPENEPKEWVPAKVERNLLRVLKTIASWKDLPLAEYLDSLLRTAHQDDLSQMAKEMMLTAPAGGADGKRAKK